MLTRILPVTVMAMALSACVAEPPSDDQAASTPSDVASSNENQSSDASASKVSGQPANAINVAASTYRHYRQGKSDPNCKEDADNKCADTALWETLCNAAELAMPEAKRSMVSYTKYGSEYEALTYLIENGGSSGASFEFEASPNGSGSCKVGFEIDGVYQGSQVRKYITGYATELFVMKTGQVVMYAGRTGAY